MRRHPLWRGPCPCAGEKLLAVVERGDVRALAVQVDADRIHLWASSDPGMCAPVA